VKELLVSDPLAILRSPFLGATKR